MVFTYAKYNQITQIKKYTVYCMFYSTKSVKKQNKRRQAFRLCFRKMIKYPNKTDLKKSVLYFNYIVLGIWSENSQNYDYIFSFFEIKVCWRQMRDYCFLKLCLTFVQWWWTSIVPSITWPTALIPERSVNISVHPEDKTQTLWSLPRDASFS